MLCNAVMDCIAWQAATCCLAPVKSRSHTAALGKGGNQMCACIAAYLVTHLVTCAIAQPNLGRQVDLPQATVLEAVLPLWADPKLAKLPRLHVIVVRILTQVRDHLHPSMGPPSLMLLLIRQCNMHSDHTFV